MGDTWNLCIVGKQSTAPYATIHARFQPSLKGLNSKSREDILSVYCFLLTDFVQRLWSTIVRPIAEQLSNPTYGFGLRPYIFTLFLTFTDFELH